MARPSRSAKQTVDLAGGGPKVSRIRRDPPPPPPKKVTPGELREREAKVILAGLFAAGLAIALILFQIGQWAGWSPSDYTIVIRTAN
jgi:hypothetical protein